jgi:hypothetical protein
MMLVFAFAAGDCLAEFSGASAAEFAGALAAASMN